MPTPPTIVLTASDPNTGTLTFSLAQNLTFPLATTTVYLLNTLTGVVVSTTTGLTPPTITLGPGIDATQPYEIVAVTVDAGPPIDISPPSRSISLLPSGWSTTRQTIVVSDYRHDADEYQLRRIDTQPPIMIATSPSHWIADTTVYADEVAADQAMYEVVPIVAGIDGGQARIVRRTRTAANLCYVTGRLMGLDANIDSDRGICFSIKNQAVRRTLEPRRMQPFYQDHQISKEELRAHCNSEGLFGVYLVQTAVVEVSIPNSSFRAEFVVPTQATADLSSLPLVPRPFRPYLS